MPGQPLDSNYRPLATELYDPVGGQFVAQKAGTTTTASDGTVYAAGLIQSVAPASVSGTLQNAAAATGVGTALSLLGNSSAQFTVTGTFVGTITWQGSEDGTNYSSLYAVQLGTNTIAATATTTGVFEASVSGLQLVRANITGYTSGAITVTAHAVPGSFSPRVTNVNIVPGNDTGLPINVPVIVQKTSNVSTGSVATLVKAFVSNNVAGNSIVVVCGIGNGTAPTVADSAGNTYTSAAIGANSTTFEAAIFYASGIVAGANTVTVTNAGTTASIAMEIYEVSGLIAQVQAQPDQTATNTGTSGTASTTALSAASPNELAFAGVAVGTAAQTITAATGWTNDSGQQNPTTPAGLFSFASLSQFLGSLKSVTPQATFTSEPWAMAAAAFRPVVLGVEGTVNLASPYPFGAIAITAASGDVAAGTAAATLAAVAGKTTYITGFSFTSTGSTSAATVDITVTGTVTGTLTYVYVSVAGATTVNAALTITFPYPIPASAANTTIVASCPTLGSGNLHAAMNAYGFQL